MKKLLKWLLLGIGGLVVLVLIALGIGAALADDYTVSSEATLGVPPDSIVAVLLDWQAMPKWMKWITRVEAAPPTNGHVTHKFVTPDGSVFIELIDTMPNAPIVVGFHDEMNYYNGRWTYEMTPSGAHGTRLKLTESGTTHMAFMRLMVRLTGRSQLNDYFKALGARFGEHVTPRAAE